MNSIKKRQDNQSSNNIKEIGPNSNTNKKNKKFTSTESNNMKNVDHNSSKKTVKDYFYLI